MFALDNLLRDASQATLPVLVPGNLFVDRDDLNLTTYYNFGVIELSLAYISEFDPSMLQLQGEEESTSGVSTVNSQHSHPEGPQASLDIYGKLQRLEEDNRRYVERSVMRMLQSSLLI